MNFVTALLTNRNRYRDKCISGRRGRFIVNICASCYLHLRYQIVIGIVEVQEPVIVDRSIGRPRSL